MRMVYHLGVHCTDEDRLIRCLLKNRGALSAEGIIVPAPSRYRSLLRDTAMQLKGQEASRDTQAMMLDQIMDEDRADRLILSWDHFIGYPKGAVRNTFYYAGPDRMRAFTRLFPDLQHEFHIAIRNPATFVPAIFTKLAAGSEAEFLAQFDLRALRWSELVEGLRRACPDVPLTLWCDEDTPLLWPDVLRAVSGHSEALQLVDDEGPLVTIMSPEGLARRRIVQAFLAKFARPEAIRVEVEMDSMTEDLVAELSAAYDRDVARLQRMDGVTVLVP
jgi:hypothetical protein